MQFVSQFDAGYSTKQVREMIPAVSARQLQWWDETGVLSPLQRGHSRQYTAEDLFGVLLIEELKGRGFTLWQIRKVRKQLARQQFTLPTERHRWLLTNGQLAVLLAHPDVVIAFLEQRRNPAYVLVSLEALAKKLEYGRAKVARPLRRGPQSAGELEAAWPREERRA
jgi:DNA-binding transcriptional MerR regulator